MIINTILNDVKHIITWMCNKNISRDETVWVFGEWLGNRGYDNAMWMANYIAETKPKIDVYWVAKKNIDMYSLHPRIVVLEKDSEAAIRIFKRAKVAVMSMGIKDFTSKGDNYFKGAITVNLWHGVPWKKIGRDNIDKKKKLTRLYSKMINEFLGADVYLTTCDDYAEILKKAFLKTNGKIIKAGHPRNALFYNIENLKMQKETVINYINREYGTNYGYDTMIITYMPTFRDHVSSNFSFVASKCIDRLYDYFKNRNIIIIEKLHFVNDQRDRYNREKNRNFITERRVYQYGHGDAQGLLGASDMLITDYSSCFFDYVLLDRPVIHYLYDYDYYKNRDRGLYFEISEVSAGDVAYDEEQLIDYILANIDCPGRNRELRNKVKERYMKYESKDSCERIYQQIIQFY